MTEKIPHAYVIGYPVKHSRSPQIHRYWLEFYGLAGSYDLAELEPEQLGPFINFLRQAENAGANVTIPYKQTVISHLDAIDEDAQNVGAVNTIYKEAGKLLGTNTDVYGFLTHLSQSVPEWHDDVEEVVIIGAGGAARAVLLSMKKANKINVHIANRTIGKAQNLANEIYARAKPIELSKLNTVLGSADLVINTTSLGMTGQPPLRFDVAVLPGHTIVADIVYSPLKTKLLQQAEDRGLRTVDGLGMLLHQAVRGFELWFGVRPQVTGELRQMVEKSLVSAS